MSTQSLIIKDGNGDQKTLSVESSSFGYIPYHRIDSSDTNAVHITASLTNPVPVTGTISVDVTVGDIINVTASAANPVYVIGAMAVNTGSTIAVTNFPAVQTVTASAAAPVYVTGAITTNDSLQTSFSLSTYAANTIPVQLIGTNGAKATIEPLNGRLFVTGAVTVNTGSTTVTLNNAVLTVTSSQTNPVYANPTPVGTVTSTAITSFLWSTSESGSFSLASKVSTRRGLTIFNPGPHNLYISLSTNGGAKNGFTISNINSAPNVYSFIVYPSGTYIADPTTVGVNYGGYFINNSASIGVFISEIS